MEIFASGLRAQAVQREGSQTPKRAYTERGVTLSEPGAHPKAGEPGRGGPAETPGPAELRIHLAYGLLLPSAPTHMLAACHADWWRDVIPSMTRSHLMPTDRSGDAHGAAGSSGSFSLSSLSPACLRLCLTCRLLARRVPKQPLQVSGTWGLRPPSTGAALAELPHPRRPHSPPALGRRQARKNAVILPAVINKHKAFYFSLSRKVRSCKLSRGTGAKRNPV